MSQNQADTPLICAYELNGEGAGLPLDAASVPDNIKSDQLTWVHLEGKHPNCRTWISQELDYLDPLIVDALLAEETRPRMLEFDQGVLLILRGVNLNENAQPEDMVSIRLWIDRHCIISVRKRPLKAVRDLRDRLDIQQGPKNTGDFICSLASRLFERMEPVFSELDETLDNLEEIVMEAPDANERHAITAIRKKAILFRRYIAPQRDAIMLLRTSDTPWLDQGQRRRLQESLDRVTRYVEDLDAIRERAQIVKDELANALSDKMNKNLYLLSVIAAIFLPLGFLTGLLGINVAGIPGTENSAAFWIVCALLTGVVMLQCLLFRKMRWF